MPDKLPILSPEDMIFVGKASARARCDGAGARQVSFADSAITFDKLAGRLRNLLQYAAVK